MPRTLAEKILLAHADADDVTPGEVVMVSCDLVMANDVSGPVAFRHVEKMGLRRPLIRRRWCSSPIISCPPRTCARPSFRSA